jgi:hypothetical protein
LAFKKLHENFEKNGRPSLNDIENIISTIMEDRQHFKEMEVSKNFFMYKVLQYGSSILQHFPCYRAKQTSKLLRNNRIFRQAERKVMRGLDVVNILKSGI